MYYAKAIRMLAVLIVAALAISVVPKLIDEPIAEDAAALDPDQYVEVGWVSEVIMWNPINMEMVEDYVVAGLMYDSLLGYDEDWGGPVNDLATDVEQTEHPNGSIETVITITMNAYFRDINDPEDMSHQLTALDVAATYNLIKNNTGGTYDWYLLDYSYFAPIQRAGVWDQVRFWCEFPKATILDDISGVPILPMYEGSYWRTTNKPLDNFDPDVNVGSGMFLFEDWMQASWYKFKKGPNYYGEVDYPGEREVKVPGILITVYGTNAAMCTDLNTGEIDCVVLTGDLNSFNNAVGGKLAKVNVIKAAVQENGITDIAINAIPDCFDVQGNYLERHEALEDPFVRKAIMMTLNKDYIVNDMLDGLPLRAASVVQPGYWQADIDEVPYDPQGAKDMLIAQGWRDIDDDEWLDAGPDVYGVQMGWFPEDTELSGIRCQAIDTDENYKAIALAWPGWAELAGINLVGSYESENTMVNQAWYACNYDIWVWHWGWGPEPIGGALTCWLTSEIEKAGDNCQMPMGEWWAYLDEDGEENVTSCPYISQAMIDEYDIFDQKTWDGRFSSFDENITIAQRTMDTAARKAILDELQQVIYDSYCENPPYYDLGLYVYTDSRFDNWGDWRAHSGLNIQAGLKWIWYMLEPVENRAPIFDDPPEDDYTAYLTNPKTFTVTLHDEEGDPMWVNFSFGDGGHEEFYFDPAPMEEITVEHAYQYTIAGEYTFTVSVCDKYDSVLAGGEIWRYIYREAPVSVAPEPNDPVEFVTTISFDPEGPVYLGTPVECSATFFDPDSGTKGTDFKVTWDWDDGTYTVEILDSVPDNEHVTSTVTHTWAIGGTFDVTVNVWDYPGLASETGEHNVSVTETYSVRSNALPDVPTIQDIAGPPDQDLECVASSSDDDLESLRFTWEWDDGTYTVQDIMPTVAGEVVDSVVTHRWTAEGTYPVTVYVEDEFGHNVSDTVDAIIDVDEPVSPSSITLTWSPSPVFVDVETTFNASATDANGDAITFTVDFGDESSPESDTTAGGTTARQYVLLTHTYSEEGTYTVNVTAEDDGGLSRYKLYTITVRGNEPPTLSIQNVYSATYAKAKTITPLEIDDPDEDDVLTVWFSWGDGDVSAGNPAANYSGTHTYMDIGVFMLQVSVNDGAGHNVSKFANVTVTEGNLQAVLEDISITPNKDEYEIGETITFVITVSDREGDNVTVTIDFGDGEDDEAVLDLDPGVDEEVTFTHEYDSSGDFDVVASVDDGQLHPDPEPDSKTETVTVAKEAVNWGLILGLVLLVIVVIVAVALLMKKRKGGAEASMQTDGMEGMAPPDESTPPPPQ